MAGPTYNASERLARGGLPPDQEKVATQADDLEKELHELKARFDQFFLGIERKNPYREAEEMRGRLVSLKSAFVRNTALKFRIQSLYQKFLSYDRLWQRTLKEMEEGTYRRDLLRLRHKNEVKKLEAATAKAPKAPKPAAEAGGGGGETSFEIFEDLGDLDLGPGIESLGAAPLPPAGAAQALGRQPTGSPSVARATPGGGAPSGRQPASGADLRAPPPTGAPAPAARQPTGSPLPRQATGAGLPPSSASAGAPLGRQATAPPRTPSPVPQTSTGSIPVPVREPGAPQANGARPGGLPLSDQKLRAIYDAYITAKKRCRESTEGLTFDAVAQSLRRQVPALLKQRGAASVDFKVVIKNGKAVLKAVPK